jgi:hypothetical protein
VAEVTAEKAAVEAYGPRKIQRFGVLARANEDVLGRRARGGGFNCSLQGFEWQCLRACATRRRCAVDKKAISIADTGRTQIARAIWPRQGRGVSASTAAARAAVATAAIATAAIATATIATAAIATAAARAAIAAAARGSCVSFRPRIGRNVAYAGACETECDEYPG